jgi:hypothetical protein
MTDRFLARYPDVPAWLYVAATPLLWPAIVVMGYSMTRGGGDSCDRLYAGDWASRDTEFRTAQVALCVGAGTMIAIGIALLGVLVARRHRLSRRRFIPCAIVTALAAATYSFIILTSGYSTDCFY